MLHNRTWPGALPAQIARFCAVVVLLALAAGCATGRAVRRADQAANSGDWDTAVASYREALGHAPSRPDLKLKLDRATRFAAAEHMRRARALESDEQWAAALAEYRLAAELDPSSTIGATKAAELERRVREQIEASRPRARVETLREQGSRPIPQLDPRAVVPQMRFTASAVRDILRTISELTGINITYDQGLDAALTRPHTIDIQETPVETVLNQVLQAQQMTFKIVDPRTIFVYQDTPQNRQRYEDQFIQNFYLSTADPTALMGSIRQLLAGLQIAVPPTMSANADSRTISVRATAPVLKVLEKFIKANDRPVPEVVIEAEILEVDRAYVRQLGLDLNQWAFGLTFSPELSPAGTSPLLPPASPPPFSINTLREGVSASDFYVTTPTALINLLESNNNTKVLARPSQRGTHGKPVTLALGSNVPLPQTVFNSAAAGGVANIPTTSVTYQNVGVNLTFTPRVTYEDEVVLEALTLEKSGLGPSIDIGGQSFPTISSRKATTNIRLRDGESTLISGLLLDDERRTARTLPGLSSVPVLRWLLGNTDRRVEQTDIVMILTAKIVRGHELTPDDFQMQYIGTGQNVGGGAAPSLISPDALQTSPAGVVGGAVTGGPGAQTPAGVGPGGVAAAVPPAAARVAEIEPIVPAGATNAPRPAAQTARLLASSPATAPDGTLASGSGPHTIPIQISGATGVASVSLIITFDPAAIRMPTITQGTFLSQGNVQVTVTPDAAGVAGRLAVSLARPALQTGANGSGVLAALTFLAGATGTTEVNVTGLITTTTGQSVPLQASPVTVVVR